MGWRQDGLTTDPRTTGAAIWQAITGPISDAWKRGDYGEAIGRGAFDIAAAIVGTKGLSKAGKFGVRAAPQGTRSLNLPFRDAALRSQIDDVVRHFDEFRTPPPGVRQGIRAGGERGVFQNVDGTLPRHADPRYYTEMDVWAGTGPRGTERLVIGRGGEVYYTPNHYESFVRIR